LSAALALILLPAHGTGEILASATRSGNHVSSIEFNGSGANSFSAHVCGESDGNAPIIFNSSSGVVVSNGVAVDPAYTTGALYQPLGGIGNNAAPASLSAKLQLTGPGQIDPNAKIITSTPEGSSSSHFVESFNSPPAY
jgi:hypothetical protein